MTPTSLADLCAIFDRDANVRAFYMVVRKGESSLEEIAYRMRYGGAQGTQYFDSFADHPRILVLIPNDPQGRKSSAAGAPQITATTYDYLRGIYTGINDYTPRTQDGLYVGCLIKTAALSLVQAGRFDDAVAAARDEWTSLPGAAENNARWTLAKARELYLEYGGTFAGNVQRDTIPADAVAKPKPRSPTMGALIALLPTVFQLFAGRAAAATQRISGAPADIAAQFVSEMGNKLVDLSGVKVTDDASALKAVAAVVDDPAKMEALQQHAIDYLEKLGPFIDKIAAYEKAEWEASEASIKAAADRNDRAKDVPLNQDRAFILAVAIISLVSFVVLSVLWKDAIVSVFGVKDIGGFSTDMQSFVIGAIVGGALTAVISYFLGSNKQSAVKDAAIETLLRATKGA